MSLDLQKARDELIASGASVVVVSQGEVLGRAEGMGIAPLKQLIDELGEAFVGSAVADRVVGKAAALFAARAGAVAIYAHVMSQGAMDYLNGLGLVIETPRVVPVILNRTGEDLCPLEKIATRTADEDEAIDRIHGFLAQLAKGE